MADRCRRQPGLRQAHTQGRDRVGYCGSYFGYDFHEDALSAATNVATLLGADTAWLTGTVGGQYDENGQLKLVATQTGQGEPLTNQALWRAFLRTPFMTLKVMTAIHWQALKIWLSGARYFPKPDPPHQEVT